MPQIRANGIDIEYESFGRNSPDPAILSHHVALAAQMTMAQDGAVRTATRPRGSASSASTIATIGRSRLHLEPSAACPIRRRLVGKMMSGQPVDVPYRESSTTWRMPMRQALLKALGIKSAHIIGASMGGMIAQLVAINHPDVTKSLISVMSTTGRRDLPPAKPEAMAALMAQPASDSREDRIKTGLVVVKTLGSPGYPGTDVESCLPPSFSPLIARLMIRRASRASSAPSSPRNRATRN